jgi:hypothetical protein
MLSTCAATPRDVGGGVTQDNTDAGAVVKETMERMNTASSLYQMYQQIVDVSFVTKKG